MDLLVQILNGLREMIKPVGLEKTEGVSCMRGTCLLGLFDNSPSKFLWVGIFIFILPFCFLFLLALPFLSFLPFLCLLAILLFLGLRSLSWCFLFLLGSLILPGLKRIGCLCLLRNSHGDTWGYEYGEIMRLLNVCVCCLYRAFSIASAGTTVLVPVLLLTSAAVIVIILILSLL